MTTTEWINVVAIFVGPILSGFLTLIITCHWQRKLAIRNEQYRVFIKLMENRYAAVNLQTTEAINAIPVVFWESKEIIQAWNAYLKATEIRDPNAITPHESKSLSSTWLDLSRKIALKLGYDIEQTQIDNPYTPKGYVDQARLQEAISKSFLRVLDNTHHFIVESEKKKT